jgi:DNA repair photolyase
MIISASRRTDIPAFHAEWFFERVKEGVVRTKNPRNVRQIKEIILSPDAVDCIVFWSKNPGPMLDKLHLIDEYPYYFHFTLNAYNSDMECAVPKRDERIETFIRLAERITPPRVIWRYDPVLLNDDYTVSYHVESFGEIARQLKGYTEKVIFSFIDFYKKADKKIKHLNVKETSAEEKNSIAHNLSAIAAENGFSIDTCAEDIDLSKYNISHGRCIDDRLISKISGRNLDVKKDKNQRAECGCVAAADIGEYNSCSHGCLYCYAN